MSDGLAVGPVSALGQIGAKGFRPFFLLAGVFAAMVVPVWVWSLTGGPAPSGALRGAVWHAHEMIFGFTVAVIAGFLLTAVESWTGHATLRGAALLTVAGVWSAARIALWWPGWIGPGLDLLLLPLVGIGIAGPLWRTRNLRNLPFVLLLAGLWLANVVVHLDAQGIWPGAALVAHRVAVHVIAVIILVVAGRVIPMFTRNATGDPRVQQLIGLDRAAIVATLVVAVLQPWAGSTLCAVVSGLAGAAVLARMWGWWAPGVLSRPLLWVLHLGHGLVGLGLLASVLPIAGVALGSSGLHLITVGGIGVLTIGMMARVSLGHTGRPISVGVGMTVAFCAVALSAVIRAFGPLLAPSATLAWWWSVAGLWSLGFAVFVSLYAGILTTARVDGRPG